MLSQESALISAILMSHLQIPKLELWLPSWVSALAQFIMQHIFRDATVIHLTDVAQPPEMSLTKNGE